MKLFILLHHEITLLKLLFFTVPGILGCVVYLIRRFFEMRKNKFRLKKKNEND